MWIAPTSSEPTQKVAVGHETSLRPSAVDDHPPALEGSADVISMPEVVVAAHHDADGQDSFEIEKVRPPIVSGATFHAAALGPGAPELSRLPPASLPTQNWSLGHAIAVSGL